MIEYRRTFPVTMDSVDAVGIVFFGAYWNWYESAFEGFIAEASGMTWSELLESGLAMPTVHAEIDYVQPLRLSDEVTVVMRLVRVGERSAHFQARFLDGEGETVADASTVNVVSSRELGSIKMPNWLAAVVEEEAPK